MATRWGGNCDRRKVDHDLASLFLRGVGRGWGGFLGGIGSEKITKCMIMKEREKGKNKNQIITDTSPTKAESVSSYGTQSKGEKSRQKKRNEKVSLIPSAGLKGKKSHPKKKKFKGTANGIKSLRAKRGFEREKNIVCQPTKGEITQDSDRGLKRRNTGGDREISRLVGETTKPTGY